MPSPVARLLPVASRRALWVGGKRLQKKRSSDARLHVAKKRVETPEILFEADSRNGNDSTDLISFCEWFQPVRSVLFGGGGFSWNHSVLLSGRLP